MNRVRTVAHNLSDYTLALMNPPFCKCGCGTIIPIVTSHKYDGVPEYIHGHQGRGRLKYPNIDVNQIIYCACGCGLRINIKACHKYIGIPKYRNGHGSKTADAREKKSVMCSVRVITEETRQKLSEAKKGNKYRLGNPGGTMLGKHHTKETIQKIKLSNKDSNKGRKHTVEELKKNSEASKRTWQNPEYREKMREIRLRQILPVKDTKPECITQEALRKFTDIETHVSLLGQPDIRIKDTNILIFIDGDFWHGNPNKYKEDDLLYHNKSLGRKLSAKEVWEKDNKITNKLKNKGYVVLRFWEHDVYNRLDICIAKIKNVLDISGGI